MLILLMMLVIGLSAGVWGFMMCFLPARWERVTEAIPFAYHWINPAPKSLRLLMRFGNRVAGLMILAAGCWFTYVAASEIWRVLAGQAVTRPVS